VTDTQVIQIAIQSITTATRLCAPILVVSLAIGLGISLLQSVTQIQEVTLTFVPKLLGVAVVVVLGGNWMLGELTSFTRRLFEMLPQLLGSA
jgi:flagellar biosynthetic protein FliQ